MMKQSQHRKLGYIETLCHLGNDELYGMGNIAGFIKISGQLSFAIVKQASNYLYKKHPLFRATIHFSQENDNCYFKFNNTFDDIPVEFKEVRNDEEANRIYEEELDRTFVAKKYLWRILFLKNVNQPEISYLIPSIHHAIADGTSSAYLVNEFFNYCHYIFYGKKIDLKSAPSYASLEELTPNSPTWNEYLSSNQGIRWGSTNTASNDEYITSLPYDQYLPIGERRTRCLRHILSTEQLRALTEKCKIENTTVNAALGVALLKSAQRRFNKKIKVMLYTAISLRKKCVPQIPVDELGCYASVIKEPYFNIKKETDDFWELARAYRANVQEKLAIGGELFPKDTTLSGSKKILNPDLIANMKEFNLNYMLTNLGRVDFTLDISPFNLEEIRFVGSRQGADQVMVIAILTVNNKMFFNFAYTYPLLSKEWAKAFFDDFFAILSDAQY